MLYFPSGPTAIQPPVLSVQWQKKESLRNPVLSPEILNLFFRAFSFLLYLLKNYEFHFLLPSPSKIKTATNLS